MEMSDIYNDLIFTMSNVYSNYNLNPPTKFTSSRRDTESLQMIMKTVPISTRIVISYVMKWGILF